MNIFTEDKTRSGKKKEKLWNLSKLESVALLAVFLIVFITGNVFAANSETGFEIKLQGELFEEIIEGVLGTVEVIYQTENEVLDSELIEGLEMGTHEFTANDFEGFELLSEETKTVELTEEQPDKKIIFEYEEENIVISFNTENPEPFMLEKPGYVDAKVTANQKVTVELSKITGQIADDVLITVYHNNRTVAELEGPTILDTSEFELEEGENTIRFYLEGPGIIDTTLSFEKAGE